MRLLEGRTHRCENYIQMCVSELHYGGVSAGSPVQQTSGFTTATLIK